MVISKINYRSREYILTLLCLSALLFNGCVISMPKLSEPDNAEKNVVKHDLPAKTSTENSEHKTSVVLGKKYLSEESAKDMDVGENAEEQDILKKIKKLETRLEAEEREREKTSLRVKKLNKQISDLQESKENVERDFAETKKELEEKNKIMSDKIKSMSTKTSKEDATAIPSKPGSGYLSDGSTVGLGIIDGDEELKVLEKIKRLETRLEAEKNKTKALDEELTNLQAAKESVEIDFANTRKEWEEKNTKLLEQISVLESKLDETVTRAIAAEQELNPIKKELLKTQISETKAQQQLYKLKIQNLKKDDEEE